MKTFALIGVGAHGIHEVLPAIKDTPGARLTAVADVHAPNLAKITEEGVARYDSLTSLLADDRPDVVYVSTRMETHHDLSLEALQAGCHVIVEKPMASTEQECQSLIDAAQAAGRQLVVMFENRYRNQYSQIRRWIREGHLGGVYAIHFNHFWRGVVQQPRRANLLNAAGTLDCGIHYLDLARFLTGGGEWAQVDALGHWFEGLDRPIHLSILAQLSHGVTVTLNDSMTVPQDRKCSNFTLLGTKGLVRDFQDPYRYELSSDTLNASVLSEPSNHVQEIPRVLADLINVLDGASSEMLPTGIDGLMAQTVTNAAHRSAAERRGYSPS